jgi:tRNA/tmRNA/rRNA uracil-C5-methylase (TrmA/RlmC/RlmD family)
MAENSIAEIAQNTLRDNFVFYSIIALLLSQVGSWVTKIIQIMRRKDRKEEIINKIAMDIVKLKEKYWEKDHHYSDMEYPAMTYFMYMREALKKNVRYTQGYLEHIEEKENKLTKKIAEMEEKILNIEKEKDDLYYIKEGYKIPDSVKKKVAEATLSFQIIYFCSLKYF